jgi:hypothetical protein
VPCGDGQCHSDYISCLRVSAFPNCVLLLCMTPPSSSSSSQSLSAQAEQLVAASKDAAALASSQQQQQIGLDQSLDSNLAAAMKSVVGRFDKQTFSAVRYEDFEQRLRAGGQL